MGWNRTRRDARPHPLKATMMEAVGDLRKRVDKLEERDQENTLVILIMYEAMLALTSDPGNPYVSAKLARDTLALAGG